MKIFGNSWRSMTKTSYISIRFVFFFFYYENELLREKSIEWRKSTTSKTIYIYTIIESNTNDKWRFVRVLFLTFLFLVREIYTHICAPTQYTCTRTHGTVNHIRPHTIRHDTTSSYCTHSSFSLSLTFNCRLVVFFHFAFIPIWQQCLRWNTTDGAYT